MTYFIPQDEDIIRSVMKAFPKGNKMDVWYFYELLLSLYIMSITIFE